MCWGLPLPRRAARWNACVRAARYLVPLLLAGCSARGAAPLGPSDAWPGDESVRVVDAAGSFRSNLSGLTYEATPGGPSVLWAARNGPGSVYRLVQHDGQWRPDTSNGWAEGKALRFRTGSGEPDAEGITLVDGRSSGGVYVASERDNSDGSVSRNSVLRFDVSGSRSPLVATHEWDLTADLPTTGANRGIEAITWVPDSALVAAGFLDATRGEPYAPPAHPDHGSGLFFVGVEATGQIYAYALDHQRQRATRIAVIETGLLGVMGLEYDVSTRALWATCDNGCGNVALILSLDTAVGSPTRGRFVPVRRLLRPSGLPNVNNEGFAIAPASSCVNGRRAVFWADDDATNGHSLRAGSIPCGAMADWVR